MTVASIGFQFVHAIGPAVFALRVLQGVSFAAAFTATTTFAAEFAPRGATRAGARPVRTIDVVDARHRSIVLGEEIVPRRYGFPTLFAMTTIVLYPS